MPSNNDFGKTRSTSRPGGGKRKNRDVNVARRQVKAVENAAARAERTDQEQLDRLVANGHGGCKEANKLRTAIAFFGEVQ